MAMDVILLERIEKLGQMGDTVKVKPGFARNYLLPQKKALRATEANRKRFEQQRATIEANNLQRRQEAEAVSPKVEGLVIVLVRQAGESGQLFGSVTPRDVAEAVNASGVTIERRQVLLDRPIKSVGLHPVRVALHPEVIVSITANVAKSEDEAKIQQETGRAVTGEVEEAPSIEELLETPPPAEAAAEEAKPEA
jgi:large subunit ribosomal protein L9